ncbi:hypothetical protein [Mycetocola sp. 2940]|uniref:hypothetical protein n=1 Tax=Mycetocola sp. 2940 TaxID=3156452 RepID=UPI003392807A
MKATAVDRELQRDGARPPVPERKPTGAGTQPKKARRPVFRRGHTQREPRSPLTVAVSILAVLSFVVVGILFAVKSQATTPAQQAYEAYAPRLVSVETATRKLGSTFTAIEIAKAEADADNAAAAAALAAVAGVSDEAARVAADAQRTAVAAAIAEITVADPADSSYDAPEVTANSSLKVIAAELNGMAAEMTRIETAQLELDAALTAITDARGIVTTAFTAFAETIPATATAILGANPDADQQWRDAVAEAVTALTLAADEGSGFEELQTYAAEVLALQAENARVVLEEETVVAPVEEDEPRQTPTRPRSTPTTPTTTPTPMPTTPGPSPGEETDDETDDQTPTPPVPPVVVPETGN